MLGRSIVRKVLKQGTRQARRALAESLEPRMLLSVTALVQSSSDSFGPTPPNFGPAALNISQFDDTTNVLLGVSVGYTVQMQTSMSGSFTNTSNANAVATATLDGTTTLAVAGNATPVTVTTSYIGPGPSTTVTAPSAVDGAVLHGEDTANAPVDPTQTPVPLAVPLIQADNSGSFALTAAQAAASGYTGGATVPGLVYSSVANAATNTSGGGSGTFLVTWNTSAEVSMDVEYFYFTPGSISGIKFNDVDGSGSQGAGEGPLSGWTINITGTTEEIVAPDGTVLLAAGVYSNSAVTDANGAYSFTGLLPGTYTISEVLQAGWVQTAPTPVPPGTHTVTLGANGLADGKPATGLDFGNQQPPVLTSEGRMTGGGSIFLPSDTIGGPEGTRVTHGFELHNAVPPDEVNNRLQINWSKSSFHLLNLTFVECSDNPIIQAPPDAPIDTLHGIGIGRFSGTFGDVSYKNVSAEVEFTFTDGGPEKGEPGIFDTANYRITVLDGDKNGTADDPVTVLNTFGPVLLTFGNHQAHNEIPPLLASSSPALMQLQKSINQTLDQMGNANISEVKLLALTQQLLSLFAKYEAAAVAAGLTV